MAVCSPLPTQWEGEGRGREESKILFVQDVIVAGSVKKENARLAALWKYVVVDCPTLTSVHVLHQDGHVEGLS